MSTAPKAMTIYPGLIGKVAVVTCASSGIGAETARYLAANMATVVVHGRNRDKLNKVAADDRWPGAVATEPSGFAVAAVRLRLARELEIASRSF